MIEEFVKQGLGSLLTQGTGWVLFVLALIVIYVQNKQITAMYKEANVVRDAAETAVKDQYDKRIAEFREIVDALGRTTTALDGMQETVEARTEAINQLVIGFSKLVRDLEVNRERWNDKGETIMRSIEDLRNHIRLIQGRTA